MRLEASGGPNPANVAALLTANSLAGARRCHTEKQVPEFHLLPQNNLNYRNERSSVGKLKNSLEEAFKSPD